MKIWSTLCNIFWTIIYCTNEHFIAFKFGKTNSQQEISQLQQKVNITVHEGHGTIVMNAIKYDHDELLEIGRIVNKNPKLKLLEHQAIKAVRSLWINRRLRGKRAGVKWYQWKRIPNAIAQAGVNWDNLVEVKIVNDHIIEAPHKAFSLTLVNIQSIKAKENELLDYLRTICTDLCVLTETWLSQDEGAWLDCTPLNNNEYRFSSSIRPDRQGGGVTLLYKSFLKVHMMEEGNLTTFQYVIWSITQSNENINMLLVVIYHPPYSMAKPVTNASFIDEFSNWLPDKLLSHKNIIIAGDFNLHVNDPNDEDAGIFLDTLTVLGLVQHFAFSTTEVIIPSI